MPSGRIVPVAEMPVVFMDELRTASISVRIHKFPQAQLFPYSINATALTWAWTR